MRAATPRGDGSTGSPVAAESSHDPAITDRLAHGREVILFDNAGVGQSTGTAPDTIEGMAARPPEVAALWTKHYDPRDEMWLPILFHPSPTSQATGRRWLERIRARKRDPDAPVSVETATSHRVAILQHRARAKRRQGDRALKSLAARYRRRRSRAFAHGAAVYEHEAIGTKRSRSCARQRSSVVSMRPM